MSQGKSGTGNWLTTSLLFFLGWVFMYADRTILSPVQGVIREEFLLSNAEVGLITSVFFIMYTAVQIPSGLLGDRFGRTKIILFGFMVFGAATALTHFASSFLMLILIRILAGFGEGFYYGPEYAISSDSTPPKYRALGYAIINNGQAVGITLGFIGSSYISFGLDLGWRVTFMAYAIPTFIVGILIYMFVKTGTHAKKVEHAKTKAGSVASIGEILGNRQLATIFFIAFCNVYGFFVMVTWLPLYLADVRHIPLSETGMIASLVAWTSVPAALLIGRLSDKIGKRKPFLLILIPVAIASIVSLVLVQEWDLLIAALVAYGLFGKLACDPIILTLISDAAPKDKLSSVYGIYNCIAMLGAILSPYITGWLRDSTNTWNSGFYFAAGMLAVGWLAAWTLRKENPVPA